MRTPKDLKKSSLIGVDPLDRRQTTGRGIHPLWKLFLVDEGDKASEETLDEVKDIADGLDNESLSCEHVAMEDHLPLDASLGGEEGGSVHWELQFQFWAEREATLRAPRGRGFDGEKHAGVGRLRFLPAVLLYEL